MMRWLALAFSAMVASAECDAAWRHALFQGTPIADHAEVPSPESYDAALKTLYVEAVKVDMERLLTDSKDCWPADFGNYGPFFIRLVWHCSGSYRKSDGRGGCGGARQRFEPERSWPDNTNLDKARALLWPLKEKYGDALSWGDLFVLAGTTALRSMGTPITQMCFGRIDDADGATSALLGPTPQQEDAMPCEVNGRCKDPLGPTTVGLIYVNPEGPVLEAGGSPRPDPALSALDIRDSFGRMGHSDRATVALIGGGHAFGKTHGACPKGAGDAPNVAFKSNSTPWPGLCGSGKGADTVTAGFEGPWTTKPTKWDNEFFQKLLSESWEKHVGPGGHYQWRIQDAKGSSADLMRLTSDIALLHDENYRALVEEFARDPEALDKAFDDAWFDLTTYYGNPEWSKEGKCDTGELRIASKMLSTDVIIFA